MQYIANHCYLCGLMCPTAPLEKGRLLEGVDACPLRQKLWPPEPSKLGADYPAVSQQLAIALAAARSPLIWIDAADVQTTRAAVALGNLIAGTIHVGQSPAGQALTALKRQRGWLGTSLAEVQEQADLVITVGERILTAHPLFQSRMLQSKAWVHIGELPRRADSSPNLGPSNRPQKPSFCFNWPRSAWYHNLSELLLKLKEEPSDQHGTQERSQLQKLLRHANYAVFAWDADEFDETTDALVLRRLLGIARELTERRRCSLLCLESQIGRVTAEETLLWLTGCPTTARFDGTRWWSTPETAHYSLADWQAFYDAILLIRSIPSAHPLPKLAATHCLLPAVAGPPTLQPSTMSGVPTTHVAILGLDCSGHCMRGDHGVTVCCRAETASGARWTAAEMLRLVGEAYRREQSRSLSAATGT